MENQFEPPATNRGVDITTGPEIREKINYKYMLFDWIQCTVFCEEEYSPRKLLKYLFNIDEDLIFCEEGGLFGYNVTYSYRNIKLFINNKREDMGYHLYCTGSACRDIEDLNIIYLDLFKKIAEFGGHYTRVDVSVDLFTDKYFTIEKIMHCIKNDEVVSKFHNSSQFIKTNLATGDNAGLTIWFGSRSSNLQIVFYDKLKERECANVPIDNDVTFWNRLECRFRTDYATEVINNYLLDNKNFNRYYFGILTNYLNFCRYSCTDKNKTRWHVYSWWSDFLEDSASIRLYNINVEKNLYNVDTWLDRSVSRSLLMCFLGVVDKTNVNHKYFDKKLVSAYHKLTTNDINFINDYRLSKGLDTLSDEEIFELVKTLE